MLYNQGEDNANRPALFRSIGDTHVGISVALRGFEVAPRQAGGSLAVASNAHPDRPTARAAAARYAS